MKRHEKVLVEGEIVNATTNLGETLYWLKVGDYHLYLQKEKYPLDAKRKLLRAIKGIRREK